MNTYEVVITAFNRLEALEETIVSIKNQSTKPTCIHLVLDGQNLDIERLGLKYGCRVHTLEHCGYPSVGRNYGLAQCTSNFVAFCDDDDIWVERKMESQLLYFERNSDIDMICTQAEYWDGKSSLRLVSPICGRINILDLMIRNPCTFSSLVIRRSASCVFDERVELKAWEDYYMFIESIIQGVKLEILPFVGVKYRINSAGKISTRHSVNRDILQLKIIGSRILKSSIWPYLFVFFPVFTLRLIRSFVYK